MNKPLFFPILDNGGGDVKAGFMLSVISGFSERPVQFARVADSHPGRGRNRAAADFLATDLEFMLFIDADIHFKRQDIDTLFESDHPLLCGVYCKKQKGVAPVAIALERDSGILDGNIRRVKRAGTGFMRIHRRVLEAMKSVAPRYTNYGRDEWDFFQSGVVGDEWLSEDWFFCDRATELGFDVMLHSGIQTYHEGSILYPIADTKAPVRSWRDIHGWFDYESFYRELARQLDDGAIFVEVGVWMGRSIGAMAEFTEGRVQLHAVDTFKGTPSDEEHRAVIDHHGGSIRQEFAANMQAIGAHVKVHETDSSIAAMTFPPLSVDAVFIDADHTREQVASDIAAWWPKIRNGGLLAGHDADYSGVKAALDESGLTYEIHGRIWFIRK